MGIGAWASRHIEQPERGFTITQIVLGLIGGFSAPILFATYAWLDGFSAVLFAIVFATGALSGLEIPLVARILETTGALRITLSNVLTADYVGALVAAILFPLLIVPQLGLMSASLVFGILNLGVAGLALWLFRDVTGWSLRLVWLAAFVLSILGLVQAERLVSAVDATLHEDEVILSETTRFQRITVTRNNNRYRLFLNGSIQFDSLDEHRYHEALVHPVMTHAPRRTDILILGGGDGMAAREVLKYPEVETVTLVDLDPAVTGLFTDHRALAALNANAFEDPRVTIINRDAWSFVDEAERLWSVIIVDLPDPQNYALSKLYSRVFYRRLAGRLAAGGLIVTQAGSPVFARSAFWSIAATLGATHDPAQEPGTRLATLPYHAYVPSFGDWGFVIAGGAIPEAPAIVPPSGLRFYRPALWEAMQLFPDDAGPLPVDENTLTDHPLVRYHEDGWARWFR